MEYEDWNVKIFLLLPDTLKNSTTFTTQVGMVRQFDSKILLKYYKSSISSLPFFALHSNFPRLVLEVHNKLLLLEQEFNHGVIEGPIGS